MRNALLLLIIFFVAFLYTKPFFQPGYFPTHDGEWAIVRLSEMQREVKDFQIPPRWSDYLNHGFGYPLFSFTYPFPYYLGAAVSFLGFGLTDTIKILFVGSVFLSAFFMFFLGKELLGSYAGFIASLFYIIMPFRLVNLYVRGSLGESLSLVLFPLLFLLAVRCIKNPTKNTLILSSLILSLLPLTHNVSALLFFPLFLFFFYTILFFSKKNIKEYTIRFLLPVVLLGLGLASYFLIPAIFEKKYILLSQIKLSDLTRNFLTLSDYISSPWSYGIRPSFQLGWEVVLASCMGLVSVSLHKKVREKYRFLILFFCISVSLLVFLTHKISYGFWVIPPLSFLDFPWRILTPLSFLIAFSTLFLSFRKITRVLGAILIFVAVVHNLSYAKPEDRFLRPDDYYRTNDATTTSQDELMPIWVNRKPRNRYEEKVNVLQGEAVTSDISFQSNTIQFQLSAKTPSTIQVNTIYFPGWKFFLNEREVPVQYDNPAGLIELRIPEGKFHVRGKFSETPIRLMGDIISIVSGIFILGLMLIPSFKKSKHI